MINNILFIIIRKLIELIYSLTSNRCKIWSNSLKWFMVTIIWITQRSTIIKLYSYKCENWSKHLLVGIVQFNIDRHLIAAQQRWFVADGQFSVLFSHEKKLFICRNSQIIVRKLMRWPKKPQIFPGHEYIWELKVLQDQAYWCLDME